ncbi:MAG: discoidin domain-containing protein [Planctomycetota bacterium]|jgi:hypothetical protein
MSVKSTCLISFVLVLALVNSASALVVSSFQEWNQRTQLADLGGLEITSTGHARFTARVDHDVTDVIIHPGGILETLDEYKLPDNRHSEPEFSNAYVYGTWNAAEIQSFGVDRAAYIYIGPEGEINLERGYDDSSTSYNVLAWLDDTQLGGRSLLVAPELDPEVWTIKIEDLGGGACRITAFGPPPAGAAMPNPEDGKTDVPRDVVLSWKPGEFAPPINGHRIYLSENFDDVNDGIGGITVSDNNYSPEQRLELNTTYYWRVDEVNAPPDNTVFEGDIWSFTTEPVAYPIENITATASSQENSNVAPENTVNGSGLSNDMHSTESETMWLSSLAGPQPTWIQYEFDKVYKLHEMWVWNSNTDLESSIGFGAKDVTIEYSIDGIDYMPLGTTHEFARATAADDYTHNTTVDLGSIQARYVRLTINSSWGGWLPQYGLSEVRFFQIPVSARNPYPDSGATGVDVDVTLGFRAGREAAEHNVYFSDDEQAVIDGTAPVTTVSQTNFSPSSLNLGKTYYWRVDEVNNANPDSLWQGDIWSFTAMDFLIIDDMESYNDLDEADPESNRIYIAWEDGITNPANGEATLTLTSNRDWTVNGVNTLTIWYIGDAANAAETMYVVLNGSAGVNNDNPNATQAEDWTEWTIDLQAFGINLTNVNTVTLGLGKRNNPVAGGSGMMYFDDIRLYAP